MKTKCVKIFNSSVFTSDNQCPKIPYFAPVYIPKCTVKTFGFIQFIRLKWFNYMLRSLEKRFKINVEY